MTASGATAKDVLLQVAVGDAQVTTLGAHIMARAYGAKLIEEPFRPIWGLETVSADTKDPLWSVDWHLRASREPSTRSRYGSYKTTPGPGGPTANAHLTNGHHRTLLRGNMRICS